MYYRNKWVSVPEAKLEKDTKSIVKDMLANFDNVWFYMPVQNGMGQHGIPDFICCIAGMFVAIETKRPGEVPTDRQAIVLDDINGADGYTLVIDGTFGDYYNLFEFLLSKVEQNFSATNLCC